MTKTKRFSLTQLKDLAKDRATQRYWYVGRSGTTKLDFGVSGAADPVLTNYPSGLSAPEGLTVITSQSGDLLFTSNGITAYDKNNIVMPGSSGGLGANGSTAQGVAAFPISNGRYMIVGNSAGSDTYDAANPGSYGILRKSIVDLKLTGSNGSVGDIEAGSIQPLTRADLNVIAGASHTIQTEPNGTENYTGQYMTAAPEGRGNGYWVVFATPGRAYLYAILFNNQGTVTKVVRSSTPNGVAVPVCRHITSGAWNAAYGTMHFNDDYDKLVLSNGLALCTYTTSTNLLPSNYDPTYYGSGWMYLLSFNNITGQFGGVYSLAANQYWYASKACIDITGSRYSPGYSADFSPDENYVYQTTIYPGRLYRYRITGSDLVSGATTIASTAQFVGITDNFDGNYANNPSYPRGGQVRRAPNDKMYVANQFSTAISVLSDPDGTSAASYSTACATRAANLSYNGLTLGGGLTSGLGLPDYSTRYTPRELQY